MSLKFVQLNVECNYHLDRLEEIIAEGPDVICLQEVFLVNLQELAKKYNYHFTFAKNLILNSKEGKFAPLGEWGVAILTKLEQMNVTKDYYALSEDDVKEVVNPPHVFPRSLITATISCPEGEYTIATTHFTWAMPDVADQVQGEDLVSLKRVLSEHPSFILSGDFNAPRGGLVQTELAKDYNYYIPDNVDSTLDSKLFRIDGLKLVIDHLFATSDYKITNVEVKEGYSDHCAIFAEIDKVTT